MVVMMRIKLTRLYSLPYFNKFREKFRDPRILDATESVNFFSGPLREFLLMIFVPCFTYYQFIINTNPP